MYIKYPASSEKKVSQKLFLDQKVRGNKSHPLVTKKTNKKIFKLKSVVDLLSKDAEKQSQSEMEEVSLFPKLGKNKNKE